MAWGLAGPTQITTCKWEDSMVVGNCNVKLEIRQGLDSEMEEEHYVYGGDSPDEGEIEGDVDTNHAEIDMTAAEDDDVKRQELAEMKKRLKEMEQEAAALRELQAKVEKEMGAVQDPASAAATQASKAEPDSHSIFVGNRQKLEEMKKLVKDMEEKVAALRETQAKVEDEMGAVEGLVVVIMGVSGSGKSTIGEMLAKRMDSSFLDADDYHSQANKCKMSKGIPLSEEDRIPWLETMRDTIRTHIINGETVILSCSALREKYREILRASDPIYKPSSYACRVKFVCLRASPEVIAERLKRRAAEGKHFMPTTLLQSQLDLFQIDDDEGIIMVDATQAPESIVDSLQSLKL